MNSFDPSPGAVPGAGLLGLSQRIPPSNLAAEQALLGALLANNKAFERVGEYLAPEHFADPVHGRIFHAIKRRVEAGQLADAVTLRAEFEHSGLLDEVGGPAYLAQLLSAMVGVINAGEYGQVIYDAWLRRQLVDLGEVVVNRAFGAEAELDAKGQLEAAEQSLFELAKEGGAGEGGFLTFERALTIAVQHAEKAFTTPGGVSGLATGLRDLDAKTGGLHPSDLLIIAGRPGMGKTALATKIAFGAAKAVLRNAQEADPNAVPKGGVALFSLEMSADQLATRLLAEESRISGDRIRRGEISQRDFDRFLEVSRELASLPLNIDDTPAISISALRTRRVLEISMITQGLKALAKELSVPVIALSQLSRAVESREDKRPQLSDLRESGSIEQDADVVMFVYRDEYYLMQRAPKELSFDNAEKFQGAVDKWQKDMEMAHNKAELIIAKQRHGPTGTIKLFFEAEFTRFGDLETQHDDGFGG